MAQLGEAAGAAEAGAEVAAGAPGDADDGGKDGPNDHVPFELDEDVQAMPTIAMSASNAAPMVALNRGSRMPGGCA